MTHEMTRGEAYKRDKNDGFYAEFDETVNDWCVFGLATGFAYKCTDEETCKEVAERMNRKAKEAQIREFKQPFEGEVGLIAGEKPERPKVLHSMLILPNGLRIDFGSPELATMMTGHLRRAFSGEMEDDELEEAVLSEFRELVSASYRE